MPELNLEYCREILCPSSGKKITDKELHANGTYIDVLMLDMDIQECFNLAIELVPELDKYSKRSMVTADVSGATYELYSALVETFKNNRYISYQQFQFLIENLSVHPLILVLSNPFLPIDLLVESKKHWHRADSIDFPHGASHIHRAFKKRSWELAAYARSIVPDSDHMTDEMLLKVAGL